MKKPWIQLSGLIAAALVLSTSFVYFSAQKQATITANGQVSSQADAQNEENGMILPQVYVNLPVPQILSLPGMPVSEESLINSDSLSSEEGQQLQNIPVAIKPSSPENNQIQEDVTGTQNAETKPGGPAIGPPIDDTPDPPPSSSESSDSSSSESSSSSSSSSSEMQQPARNALEKYLNMPAYTPYGKTLTIRCGGVTYKADAVVVVSGMLQAEMIGNGTIVNNHPYYHEAYKAQAIASHSYVKCQNNRGMPADVYVKAPTAQTVRLVEQVISKLVYYNGSVAETVYHASSGLHTQGSQYYWGGTIPYLQGVVSKYDEAASTKVFTLEEMRKKLQSNGYDTSGDPSDWFQVLSYSDGGFIYKVKICGKEKTGMSLHYLLNLRSSKAQIEFDGSQFVFYVNGFGHGVGMSQIGALGYSRYDGWNYNQILTHYYTGCVVR